LPLDMTSGQPEASFELAHVSVGQQDLLGSVSFALLDRRSRVGNPRNAGCLPCPHFRNGVRRGSGPSYSTLGHWIPPRPVQKCLLVQQPKWCKSL
jgi:hypothetical protein